MKEMVRRLGQLAALLAMMAFIVNAQCALLCSLPSSASLPADASQVDPDQSDHACCPHQGQPKPTQPKDERPCPPSAPTADATRLNISSANLNPAPDVIAVGSGHEYCPSLDGSHRSSLTGSVPPRRSHPSSIDILRV
jgi:hypothetical protein